MDKAERGARRAGAIERRASVVWEGSLEGGQGRLTAESSEVIVAMPLSWDARITESDGPGAVGRTSPEELLAAAHASCFAMSLAAALGRAGMVPDRLEVLARCALEKAPDGLRIASMRLTAGVRAAGLETDTLEEVARAAEERCPVSRALDGRLDIHLESRLLGAAASERGSAEDPSRLTP